MRELVRTIERALEQEHEKALTYAMQYGTGWEAYKRLRAFKEALERREAATASKKATRKLAA